MDASPQIAGAHRAPDTAPPDPLDDLLRQIIGGFFVLTDGQGALSKWSETAELLFGLDASEALGRPFFGTLAETPLPEAGEHWRRFLEEAQPPQSVAQVELVARNAQADTRFPLEMVFVPVKLDEGFDFSLFLEDLGFELPMNLMLMRMRQQHPVVMRALRAALSEEPQPWEGWRTAGTLVAFRPTAPTPWVEAELRRREEEKAAADADLEERITETDPGIQGSIHDLDDAAAVVSRIIDAFERIEVLEATVADVQPAGPDVELLARLGRLEQARADDQRALESQAGHRDEIVGRMDAIERLQAAGADALQARLDAALDQAAAEAEVRHAELRARLERLESDQAEALKDEIVALRGELEGAARNHFDAASESAAALRERVERLEGADHAAGLAERLERLEVATDVSALVERLDRLEGEQAGAVPGHELDGLRHRIDETLRDAGEERRRLEERIDGVSEDAAGTRTRLDALQHEGAHTRADVDALRRDGGELRAAIDELRGEREEARAAARDIVRQIDELRAHVDSRPVPVTEPDGDRPLGDEARAELSELRREADSIRSRLDGLVDDVASATRRADEAHAEASGARHEAVAAREEAREDDRQLRDRVDQVDRGAGTVLGEVRAMRDRLDQMAGEVDEVRAAAARADEASAVAHAAGERLDAVAAEAAQARQTAGAVADRVDGVDKRVTEIDTRAAALAEQASAAAERLDTLGADVERLRDGIQDEAAVRDGAIEALRADAESAQGGVAEAREAVAALRAEAEEVRALARAAAEAPSGDEAIDELRSELVGLRAVLAEYKTGFEEARQAAVLARRDAEEAKRAIDSAGSSVDAGRRLQEAFHEVLARTADANAHQPSRSLKRTAAPKEAEPPARPPRPGFDDNARPLAVLTLDGHFKELNPAFSKLVGYPEHKFAKAVWPSVHDRGSLKDCQEQLRELASGQIDQIEIQSTYLHGQGLMVLVEGLLKLVRDGQGDPSHLLLEAEERQAPA